jgi:6-phosphogluconolactonase
MRTLLFLLILIPSFLTAQDYYLFVGTYTSGASKGIYVYRYNPGSGNVSLVSTIAAENPSYLALSQDDKNLYAVNENGGDKPGTVSSFAFDKKSGSLRLLNTRPSAGDHPCYVSIDNKKQHVVVGNYTGGNLSIFPVASNGSLAPASQIIVHAGKGTNPDRQEKAHVHAVVFSPDNNRLFVPDLGLDKVLVYDYTPSASKPLKELVRHHVKTTPGSGPRHLVFHPTRPFAYLVEELTGTVSAYRYDDGRLVFLQRLSTFVKGHKGEKGSADIHVSPDGRHLYISNRGKVNNLAIFLIESSIGTLRLQGFQSTGGLTPRNFIIDPTGNFVLIANQNSNNITVFKRNAGSGLLTRLKHSIEVPNPVCLKLMRL